VRDVIEISYTGDLLAHRRCARAWSFEKQAGFYPYEQVQAMEGRLVHHALEWLSRHFSDVLKRSRHVTKNELEAQLDHYFRVLWARGLRTTFFSKRETLDRVVNNLFPDGAMHPTVKAVVEGAQHTEYELRSVRKLLPKLPRGKSKLLLTGVLDLVVQQQAPLTYERSWQWTSVKDLDGKAEKSKTHAKAMDVEIWDYKGSRSDTPYLIDYVRQLLTYAALYEERVGVLPARCVLFFVNEPERWKQLVAVPVDSAVVKQAVDWTYEQVDNLQETIALFQNDPCSVPGGDFEKRRATVGQRMTEELKQQCTACGFRFDCDEYRTHLRSSGHKPHPDVDIYNVRKN
jgi:hypothetical protein